MLDVTVIEDPEAAAVSLDPTRARLLAELAAGPASAAMLAGKVRLKYTHTHTAHSLALVLTHTHTYARKPPTPRALTRTCTHAITCMHNPDTPSTLTATLDHRTFDTPPWLWMLMASPWPSRRFTIR